MKKRYFEKKKKLFLCSLCFFFLCVALPLDMLTNITALQTIIPPRSFCSTISTLIFADFKACYRRDILKHPRNLLIQRTVQGWSKVDSYITRVFTCFLPFAPLYPTALLLLLLGLLLSSPHKTVLAESAAVSYLLTFLASLLPCLSFIRDTNL